MTVTTLRYEAGRVAERYAEYVRLRRAGESLRDAAARLCVTERTAQRYEQRRVRQDGVTTRQRPADWMRPGILAHLNAYPGLRFSCWDLARVLDGSANTAARTLSRLAAAGLVEVVVEPMDSCDQRPVSRYRIARPSVAELREAA